MNGVNLHVPNYGPQRRTKKIILCFDGTGNKFSGTVADSNILKIYRMLDRGDPDQLHYYQPGIGTYIESKSLSHTSVPARLNSWLQKSKDSAVGSSFDKHVMQAYQFLMRYYSSGDEIYFFGFSRGAYTARFLAEMLDHVGLLSTGNEEMARFAWKAFARWQQRKDGTDEEKEEKKKMFEYLTGFRETFSRPVRRIRFLGLFDTVNSVPRFENAWMQRSKFPYTARSSALIIRHAVCIDERRAKFRQDLIGEAIVMDFHRHHHLREKVAPRGRSKEKTDEKGNKATTSAKTTEPLTAANAVGQSGRFRRPSQVATRHGRLSVPDVGRRSTSPSKSLGPVPEKDRRSISSAGSYLSLQMQYDQLNGGDDDMEAEEDQKQDIEEVWFPGGHGDLGGGWIPSPNEEFQLSHIPLVWIVGEARKAGLSFDYEQMRRLKCIDDFEESEIRVNASRRRRDAIPQVHITGSGSPDSTRSPTDETVTTAATVQNPTELSAFHRALHHASTLSVKHDCLAFGGGLKASSVLSWKIMEYMPFRRMDLQPDGSWKSISWPLPRGEVRDIPDNAWIHNSAMKRMKADPGYRPGNLIVGGGGRGVKIAPEKYGTGVWELLKGENDPVCEVYIRKKPETDEKGQKEEH